MTGFDFNEYAPIALKRRVSERARAEQVATVAGLLERVLHDERALAELVDALSSRQTELFEDLAFFRAVRSYVVRWLRTFPVVRVWVVGNASDAFALHIVFLEEHLDRMTRVYATEPTQRAAERAGAGIDRTRRTPPGRAQLCRGRWPIHARSLHRVRRGRRAVRR